MAGIRDTHRKVRDLAERIQAEEKDREIAATLSIHENPDVQEVADSLRLESFRESGMNPVVYKDIEDSMKEMKKKRR